MFPNGLLHTLLNDVLPLNCFLLHFQQSAFNTVLLLILARPQRTRREGGTPIYGLYRYVLRDRVGFLRFSMLE